MTTWGIDGVLFTGIYGGVLAATTAAAVLRDGRRGAPARHDDLDDYDTAYLAGGARLAAVVALVNLQRRGLIDLGDQLLRELERSGDLDLAAVHDADHLADLGVELHVAAMTATAGVTHPVEAAALQAVHGTKPGTPWRVVSAVTATKAVDRVRSGLVERGLLYEQADVGRLQGRWRWLVPLLALGLVAGIGAGVAFGPLAVAAFLTVVAMVVLARRRPTNSRRGDRLVAELRRREPEMLAATGTDGLRSSDPALALVVAVPSWAERAPAKPTRRRSTPRWFESAAGARSAGWWGGTSCGAGWGDGGGGGGGDGGGGGCGGGGGGCGGGG